MNDTFRELKLRIRKLDELLTARGQANVAFAQAVSRVRRLERRSDRSREPTPELRGLLEQAEHLARGIA